MRKNLLVLSLMFAMIALPSCSSGGNTQNNQSELENDIAFLSSHEAQVFNQEECSYFNLVAARKIKYDDAYFYTVTIAYSNKELTNFKIIMAPESISNMNTSNVESFGYNFRINLAETSDKQQAKYKGINASYKVTNDNENFVFYVGASDPEINMIFKITDFE